MRSYSGLLHGVAEWSQMVQARHASEMQCRRGCVLCCYGLFDISLPDALHVALSLSALPAETRSAVTASAAEIQKKITKQAPELKAPYLLKMGDDLLIDRIVTRVPSPRCPFLAPDDTCLIYEHRPLACRMEGIPMVDIHDGLFGDWCELNFVAGVPSDAQDDLLRNYYELHDIEKSTTAKLSELLLGERQEVLTVFIPSLIVEYENFWAPLLAKLDPADLEFRLPGGEA
jgi:Fe-S-cluster containining protein